MFGKTNILVINIIIIDNISYSEYGLYEKDIYKQFYDLDLNRKNSVSSKLIIFNRIFIFKKDLTGYLSYIINEGKIKKYSYYNNDII